MSENGEYFYHFSQPFNDFARKCRAECVYNDPFTVQDTALGTNVRILGKPGTITSFISLDYLGLGHLPDLVERCAENVRKYGTGFASSRTVMDSCSHQNLERALSDFKRSEGCVLANTGYGANVMLAFLLFGPMSVLGKRFQVKRNAVVCVDALSHASLHDALTTLKSKSGGVSGVEVKKYAHLDYAALSELLEGTQSEDVDRFIVSDSLFSMNGDFADVNKLFALAKQYQAFLVLDNAHSDGVYGSEGRGCVEAAGICNPDDLKFIFQSGTLSKAFAGIGGYITLFPSLAELARFSQWSYIFSVALPTFLVATYQQSLDIVRGEVGDNRRKSLQMNAAQARKQLQAEGFNIFDSSSHIIPVVIGDGPKCLRVQGYLVDEHNLLLGAIRYPAVARNKALLRLSLSSLHTDSNLEQLLHGLKRAREKFKF